MRYLYRRIRPVLFRIKRKAMSQIYKVQGRQLVHFLHVGKTGGTALKYALNQYPVDRRYVIRLHRHRVKLRDIPRGENVIFSVRDPISRFVSGFYSRKRQGQPRIFLPWTPAERRAFEYFSTPNQLAIALSSTNKEERERAYEAMRCIGHIRTSYWDWFEDETYFRSRIEDIFFICFQERLTQDFEVLKAKLGMSRHAALPTDSVLAHRNPEGIDKSLTNEAIENLKKWYEDDFRFLDICREAVSEHPDIYAVPI